MGIDQAARDRGRHLRTTVACLLLVCGSVPASREAAAEWYVGCDRGSGAIVLGESLDEELVVVVSGPFAGRRTARFWVDENCPGDRCAETGPCSIAAARAEPDLGWLPVCDPTTGEIDLVKPPLSPGARVLVVEGAAQSLHDDEAEGRVWISRVCPTWRCDAQGRCLHSTAEQAARDGSQPGGGWVAGELSSVSLSDGGSSPPTAQTPSVVGVPARPSDLGSPDLGPLINNAGAAVDACNYRAALASADHMLNFDPSHPWLAANHDRLRTLARRQQTTEQILVQASSELSANNLKKARKLASTAADTALSCQSEVVGGLIRGIDTAIAQRQALRQAKRTQAVAAMLPGLISLSRVVSGAASAGVSPDANALVAATAETLGLSLPGGVDPCAFRYEYRDVSHVQPACTCTGYVFDTRQFRCIPVGR